MAIQPDAFFQQFDDSKLVAADKAHYMHGFHTVSYTHLTLPTKRIV